MSANKFEDVMPDNIKDFKFFVTMTDKFMSGWGMAQDKTAKYIYCCETLEQAEQIEKVANSRKDQTYINICSNPPYRFNSNAFYTTWITPPKNKEDDYQAWYKGTAKF